MEKEQKSFIWNTINEIFSKKEIKTILYIASALWLAFGTQYMVNRVFKEKVKITEAFVKMELEEMESTVEIIVKHSDYIISESDKLNIIYQIAKTINLNLDDGIEVSEIDNQTVYYVDKKAKNANTQIKVATFKDNNTINNYIIVRLTLLNDMSNIDKYKELLNDVFKEMGLKEQQISLEYTGSYNGVLAQREKERIAFDIIKDLQGTKVLEHDEENMYILYGYTGLIGEYVKSSGNRINIQVVITYDKETNKTKVYFATPFLNHSY